MLTADIKTLLEFRRAPSGDRCGLCARPLGAAHSHLLQRSTKRVVCSCEACAVLFGYRKENHELLRIPSQARRLDCFRITDAQWNALLLPIDLAFFLKRDQPEAIAAYYPSPAGNTESLLSLESWGAIVEDNPELAALQPEIEALLVNRTNGRREYFIAPIDQCYRLTGLIRMHWRGLSGGEAVWREITGFFDSLSVASHEAVHA